jgi:Ca-activated chloride channel family protein
MVTPSPEIAVVIALAVSVLVVAAEWLHARRVERVRRLAFGESRMPQRAMFAASLLRVVGAGAAAWGLLFLVGYDPVAVDTTPSKAASNHLLLLLDVSPSMQLQDAGAQDPKISRAQRAGEVVQAVLDRLDMESTRITIVAFYTDALPVVRDTFDKEVVRNALDGLPMYVAFEPGPTDLRKGLEQAWDIARKWPPDSATLLIVTDGDVTATHTESTPASIADTIIVGLGDPVRGMIVNGHSSRQDTASLKRVAMQLGGIYHDGNAKHIPSQVIRDLTMVAPRIGAHWSLRDLAIALAALGLGALSAAAPLLRFLMFCVRVRASTLSALHPSRKAIA